ICSAATPERPRARGRGSATAREPVALRSQNRMASEYLWGWRVFCSWSQIRYQYQSNESQRAKTADHRLGPPDVARLPRRISVLDFVMSVMRQLDRRHFQRAE